MRHLPEPLREEIDILANYLTGLEDDIAYYGPRVLLGVGIGVGGLIAGKIIYDYVTKKHRRDNNID